MNGLLAGKTVLVTGAANGIGRACAAMAAAQGAEAVIALDLTSEPRDGASVEALVTEAGAAFHFLAADVSRAADLETGVALAEPYGGLDLMVCSAGMALRGDGIDVGDEDFDRLVEINLKGVFLSARSAARPMITRGLGGSIVIVASMGAVRGSPVTMNYCATKAAAKSYAQSFAAMLGPHKIRVNAVCPGTIDTGFMPPNPDPRVAALLDARRERTPLRRTGTPDEVAGPVIWLGSNLSTFVTGTSIMIDGGLTAII